MSFEHHRDGDHEPCDPGDRGDDRHGEGAVVGAGEQGAEFAGVGVPRCGADGDQQEGHAGDEKQDDERGRETSQPLAKGGLSHRSLPPRLRINRAEAWLLTLRSPMPMKLRNFGR